MVKASVMKTRSYCLMVRQARSWTCQDLLIGELGTRSRRRFTLVNVCVPVLRRYDLLQKMLKSLERSTLLPDCVYIIDNGKNAQQLKAALSDCQLSLVRTKTPEKPMGVAESWNWFLENVDE